MSTDDHFHELDSEPVNEHNVGMFEFKKASGTDVLDSGGLGPCTGIAIYDAKTKIGHLGHFLYPALQREIVESMLESALSAVTGPADLKVWVRGGSTSREDFDDTRTDPQYASQQESNEYIEELLRAVGIKDIDVEWSGDRLLNVNMRLDCRTGQCEIDVWDMTEFYRSVGEAAIFKDL